MSFIDYIENFIFEEEKTLFDSKENTAKGTEKEYVCINENEYVCYRNEFWTAKQRQSSSIHEISYRACFKAELPRFFIEKLSKPGDIVFDPFSGRGTTVIEAGLLDRNVIANDINPLSTILSEARFLVPLYSDIETRLNEIVFNYDEKADIDLSMFYHSKTEAEIASLKKYLKNKTENNTEDALDKWIKMVATNRLTGHSPGFFSVYTLPPNQATSQERQIKINKKRNQEPEYRDTKKIILKKTKTLLKNINNNVSKQLFKTHDKALFINQNAQNISRISDNTVQLTVTSPPFLNIVQYATDNWLRCWFNNIDAKEIEKKITCSTTKEDWEAQMQLVFNELYRITKKEGFVAFEVGEIKKGKLKLEEIVVPIGLKSGFNFEFILINEQIFTKTANIWGVKNNSRGTNSNRIVVFSKS